LFSIFQGNVFLACTENRNSENIIKKGFLPGIRIRISEGIRG
jgi:hypothetical protein